MSDRFFVGLMSGTSLDGIDAVVANFKQADQKSGLTVTETHFQPYPDALKAQLLKLQSPSHDELAQAAIAGNLLAKEYASAVKQLLDKAGLDATQVTAIGCHGQTIRHQPILADNAVGYSIQIGNAALLAELSNIDVISDFRNRDISAGGQGAPLVPAFHAECFSSAHENRAIVNIGGIANITYLPNNAASHHATGVFGFDSGPGNVLLDAWIKTHLNKNYDSNGEWSRSGNLIGPLLSDLLDEPYFDQAPPKSTGRDLFNESWLATKLKSSYKIEDVAHTLTRFTAGSICDALTKHCPTIDAIYIHGGGVHNHFLLEQMDQLIHQQLGRKIPIYPTNKIAIDADWVEAVAFAWLAKKCIDHEPANLPSVTGAAGSRILGTMSQS